MDQVRLPLLFTFFFDSFLQESTSVDHTARKRAKLSKAPSSAADCDDAFEPRPLTMPPGTSSELIGSAEASTPLLPSKQTHTQGFNWPRRVIGEDEAQGKTRRRGEFA